MSGLALAVVGLAMGGKAIVDGIQEGNIGKAIMGGVGAYFAMNGIAGAGGAGESAASKAVGDLGSNASNAMADSMAAANAAPAAGAATQGLGTNAAGMGGMETVNDIANKTLGIPPSTPAGPMVGDPNYIPRGVTPPDAGGGFLGKAGAWMEKNPAKAFGLMQTAGSLVSGYAQGQMLEDQRKAMEKREDEARRRREYSARPGFLSGGYAYNPGAMNWSKPNG